MKKYFSVFLGAWFLIVPTFAHADIRINEVAWMGTAASQYSEWIELYNDGTDAVSLAGWKLYKTGETLLFTLSKSIAAGGYLLVERTTATAPDAIPGINDEAGTFGGGGLRNSGEDLSLEDKEGTVINILPFAGGWPAGDAKSKDTMQWNGTKWITAPGTPDAVNATAEASAAVPVAQTPEATAPVVMTQPVAQTPAVDDIPPISDPLVTNDNPVPAPIVMAQPVTQTETPATIPITNAEPIVSTLPAARIEQTKPVSAKKKATVAKEKSAPTSTVTVTDTANENAADQLQQDATTAPQIENNHTKIFILGAVAFIGMALFLLLMRFKAR